MKRERERERKTAVEEHLLPTYILHRYPDVDRISDNDLCFSCHFAASFFGMYFRMVVIGCKLK